MPPITSSAAPATTTAADRIHAVAISADVEILRLTELENIIDKGRQTFIEVGMALEEILHDRLYCQRGFATFEEYVSMHLHLARRQAYNYISAVTVAANVHSNAQTPPSLTQCVELAVLDPDHQREIATKVDFGTTSVRDLKKRVKQIRDPKPADVTLAAIGTDSIAIHAFLLNLRKEITRRRKENNAKREQRVWNVESVLKVELIALVDFIEKELDRIVVPAETVLKPYKRARLHRSLITESPFKMEAKRLCRAYDNYRPGVIHGLQTIRDESGAITDVQIITKPIGGGGAGGGNA